MTVRGFKENFKSEVVSRPVDEIQWAMAVQSGLQFLFGVWKVF